MTFKTTSAASLEIKKHLINTTIKLKKRKHLHKHANNTINFHEVIKNAEKQHTILLKRFGMLALRKHFLGYYPKLKNKDIKA